MRADLKVGLYDILKNMVRPIGLAPTVAASIARRTSSLPTSMA
jgi:hypothetical protein